MEFERVFRLSERIGQGVFCGRDGLFVGDIPVLEFTTRNGTNFNGWRVRELSTLECELSKTYGVQVKFGSKVERAGVIAEALTRGDLPLAQIAMLLLGIPDPPVPIRGQSNGGNSIELLQKLHASELLKWDPDKHPRWPAGSPNSVGGEFKPSGSGDADVVPAQVTIPLEGPELIPLPLARPLPLPSEIAPPLVAPVLPRTIPQNPYPSRPERVREWKEAYEFCWDLKSTGRLGKGAYRGMGRTMRDCMLGQVSESCGGNAASA